MKITIQTLDKKMFDVNLEENHTIIDLKKEIEKEKNHPFDQMKIIFSGNVLDQNDKKLKDYNLVDGAKIILLMQKKKVIIPEEKKDNVQLENLPIPQNITTTTSSQNSISQGPVLNQMLQSPEMLIQFLMNNPNIQQTLQNPQFIQQLGSNNNLINQLMTQLMETQEPEDEIYDKFFEGELNLTENEKKDIEEIVSSGLGSFEDVVQFYIACDKNKNNTLQALLNDNLDHQV